MNSTSLATKLGHMLGYVVIAACFAVILGCLALALKLIYGALFS